MKRLRVNSGVRWREDTGYELRCIDCTTYWPLTPEFWRKTGFTRCKGCWDTKRRLSNKKSYRKPEIRAKRLAYQDGYRKEARDAKRLYALERYWSDPEAERAKAKERYYAKRDEILAKKRAAHAAKKAA